MSASIKPRICANLTINDGVSKVFEIHENDIIHDLKYRKSGEEVTISGAIRVINVSTNKVTIAQTCPPESYFSKLVNITSMIIDCSTEFDADLVNIAVADIISIGSVERPDEANVVPVGVGPQYQTIDKIVDSVEAGATLKLAEGEYTPALNVTKSVTLVGPNDVPQNIVPVTFMARTAVAVDESSVTKAVLSGKISINNPEADVEIRGVTFSGNALVEVTAAKSVKLINCRFEGITADKAKTHVVNLLTNTTPTLVVIEGNYFGDSIMTETFKCYNGLELTVPLADGSSISNNYWTEDHITHNQISVYGAENGATITISGNHAVKSANLIRLGIKDAPSCVINCNDNSYDTTDESDDYKWAGLLLVQPYGMQTTSFANCTIHINNTVHSDDKQIAYLYNGTNDMKFNDTNKPTIYVDGTVYDAPLYS